MTMGSPSPDTPQVAHMDRSRRGLHFDGGDIECRIRILLIHDAIFFVSFSLSSPQAICDHFGASILEGRSAVFRSLSGSHSQSTRRNSSIRLAMDLDTDDEQGGSGVSADPPAAPERMLADSCLAPQSALTQLRQLLFAREFGGFSGLPTSS